jgi:hypothetical protein
MTGSLPRSARSVVEELFQRQREADETVLDDLVATDMINHAAGPQGREGLRSILRTIEVDLGPIELEQLVTLSLPEATKGSASASMSLPSRGRCAGSAARG